MPGMKHVPFERAQISNSQDLVTWLLGMPEDALKAPGQDGQDCTSCS